MAKRKYNLLIKASIVLAALLIGGMLLITATHTHDEVAGLAAATENLNETFRYFRWAALLLLIVFWESVVDLYGKYKGLTDTQIEYAKSLQFRIGAMLIAFDLLVIEGLPAKLIELI